MTLCNMSIEAGARAGMVAPDETTFTYIKNRRFAPHNGDWEKTLAHWRTLPSDPGSRYDKVVEIDASKLAPFVTWGTNPGMVVAVSGRVPDLSQLKTDTDRRAAERMLEYMGLEPGTRVEEIPVYRVFIGSCTNSRLDESSSHGGAGIASCETCSREGRPGPDFPGRGLRVARVRLLHVPGHEP